MLSFVLGATTHGPLIFSLLDYVNTPDGLTYGVGAQLMRRGEYEAEEIAAIKAMLDVRRTHFGDGVVMVDAGANIGCISVECGRHMAGWGEVTAFEPQERVFYALCGNVALSNLWNVRARMEALGKQSGAVGVPQPDYQRPASFGSLELDGRNDDLGQSVDAGTKRNFVPVRMIDEFGLKRLDLLKVDVEGMEVQVLKGAEQTIRRCQPIMLLEFTKSGYAVLRDMLAGMGYDVHPVGRMNVIAVPKGAEYVREKTVIWRGDADGAFDRAVQMGEDGKSAEALAIFDKIIEGDPDNHLAYLDRGTVLMQLGRYQEAIGDYQVVIDLGPEKWRDRAVFSRGFCRLVLGQLREGFADFERRKVVELPEAITSKPEWMGWTGFETNIRDKTLLVVGEMGFGDNIMFSRYYRNLVAAGANVVVTCPPELRSLFATLPYIQMHSEHSPPFDCWVRNMSLAERFGTDIDTVPPPTEFDLRADAVARMRYYLNTQSADGDLKVGLCWSGGRNSQYDKHRNVPLAALAPLLDVDGVSFYSLQPDVRHEDKESYDAFDEIIGVGDKLKSFLDTACVVKNLDLVITVDTSVAHLAGTIGVPTWVMLTSFRTYWMWIKGRDDSPWYPSMRCFRQSVDGQWGDVVERVVSELERFRDYRSKTTELAVR